MYALYIGENSTNREYMKSLWNGSIHCTNTPFKARSYIFEHWYSVAGPIFIFLEYTDEETTSKYIEQLKKNKSSNQYLLLVGDHIPQPEIIHYLQRGINEIIPPDITQENLQHILSILPLIQKSPESEVSIQTFHLPLWKRSFDVLFSLGALTALSPLLVITSLAIRIESKGPIIYTSQRVGSNYKIFGFLKFRSMYRDADKRLKEFQALNQYQTQSQENERPKQESEDSKGAIFVGDDFHLTEEEYLKRRKKLKENNFIKLQNDPRITHVGKIIRKYSIDELPQLINILKGDMSIVGNRPLPLYEAEQLTSDEYIERFMAPSGLTGLWQVEKRGTEGILSPEERKQLDIQYARKFSFLFDMKIILRTFTAFIQKENV